MINKNREQNIQTEMDHIKADKLSRPQFEVKINILLSACRTLDNTNRSFILYNQIGSLIKRNLKLYH